MKRVFVLSICFVAACSTMPQESTNASAQVSPPPAPAQYGELLCVSGDAAVWWASSGWKIPVDRPLPAAHGTAVRIQCAANETDAAQLVLRPSNTLRIDDVRVTDLNGPGGAKIASDNVDLLRVHYVQVTQPTDSSSTAGPWPDPLPPLDTPITVAAGLNLPIWVRVHVPKATPAGTYQGEIILSAHDFQAKVPLHVEVFGFELPDRMTCVSAFGFSPGLVYRYHNLTDPAHQRAVMDEYLQNFSDHHITPYDPTPLDDPDVQWPDVIPGQPVDPATLKVTFDWAAWDAALDRAFDQYHFNSLLLPAAGLGGGTFHSRVEPELLGFPEDTPEYQALFHSYWSQLEEHLREKGWLDKGYVYWFDEPDPKDYDFVMNGFHKLEEAAPDITRMLTEQVEPALIGGPNLWCPISPAFNQEAADARRAEGEKFWWYVCTGPKAPFATLFIDHPATDLRVWLWQTWQRNIDGILVWQSNYWTSDAAYPDHPQNPYDDPMGWTSGYSTEAGKRIPWGNGDGRFIYPPLAAANANPAEPVIEGPVDSIRWEMLRDGIEDYEYLTILKRLLEEKKDKLSEAQIAQYLALLTVPEVITTDMTHFTKEPAPIETRRLELARAIEEFMAL